MADAGYRSQSLILDRPASRLANVVANLVHGGGIVDEGDDPGLTGADWAIQRQGFMYCFNAIRHFDETARGFGLKFPRRAPIMNLSAVYSRSRNPSEIAIEAHPIRLTL